MNKLLLILTITILTFASCEECKDCQITYETLNGYNISDLNEGAVILGYPDWQSYMQAMHPSQEYCDGDLDAAEDISESTDLDGDGTMDYRVYWDCK